jgi:hypothetical protein
MGTMTITTEEHVVNTGRSTTPIELPLSQPMIGTRLKSGRPAIHIADSAENVDVKFAYWTSDDAVTWSSANTLSGYNAVKSNGWHFGTTFVSFNQAPYVRFGLLVNNDTGSLTEYARVMISLEAKY